MARATPSTQSLEVHLCWSMHACRRAYGAVHFLMISPRRGTRCSVELWNTRSGVSTYNIRSGSFHDVHAIVGGTSILVIRCMHACGPEHFLINSLNPAVVHVEGSQNTGGVPSLAVVARRSTRLLAATTAGAARLLGLSHAASSDFGGRRECGLIERPPPLLMMKALSHAQSLVEECGRATQRYLAPMSPHEFGSRLNVYA